jgi:predicted Zn-dependent protease
MNSLYYRSTESIRERCRRRLVRITLAKIRLRDLLVFLTISLCVTGCNNTKNLYFVPIGDAPTSEINALVTYYNQKFGIEIHVLPQIAPRPSDLEPQRQQLIAENVIQTMLRMYPKYANDRTSILIGITGQDIYPLGAGWHFCFGWRIPDSRSAIVSTARMNLEYPGEPAAEATVEKRLRKTVTKDIGILYYGMSPNNNPQSVLYSGILGIQELDRVTEDFAPNAQTTPNIPLFVLAGVLASIISGAVIRFLAKLGGSNPAYGYVGESAVSALDGTEERYAAAWRDRRRRFLVLKATQLSFFALLVALLIVTRRHPYVAPRPVLLGFAAWFIAYMVAGAWLNRFRCPRCGKLYYWRWELKGYTEREKRWTDCRYCGLHQDEMPLQTQAIAVSAR